MRTFSTSILTVLWALAGLSCSQAPDSHSVIRYEPQIVPTVDEARFPFPSDAYRKDGKLVFRAAADAVPARAQLLLPALAKSGYGTQQAIYFGVEGDMPEQPWPITATGAGAGIVAVKANAVPVLEPAEVLIDRERGLISVTPALGYPLPSGQSYLVYVLEKMGVGASATFERVRDGHPQNATERRLARQLDVALAQAAGLLNVPRSHIVAATLFTPADPTADVLFIRKRILDAAPPTPSFAPQWHYGSGGLPLDDLYGTPTASHVARDNNGGVLHDKVADVYMGALPLRQWIVARERSSFSYDAFGKPVEQVTNAVSFVLTLPDCPRPPNGYPVSIVQHGLNAEKSFALIMSNTLAKHCMAAVGIDAVNHGANAFGAHDRLTNITGKPVPDGMGDGRPLAGLDQIYLLKPLTARDNLRQSSLNLLQLYHSLNKAAWLPGAATQTVIDGDNITYIGESMGSVVGAPAVALMPDLRAASLIVGGGNFMRLFSEGPGFRDFLPAIALLTDLDPTRSPRRDHPVLAMLQGILDGADPINYARYWLREPLPGARPHNILVPTAERDQLVSTSSSEGMAIAGGLGFVQDYINWRKNFEIAPLPAPVQGNVETNAGRYTAAVIMFPEANHGLAQHRCATIEHEAYYPWRRLARPYPIANPTARAQQIIGDFLADSLDGGIPAIPAPGADGSAILYPDDCG